MDIPKNVGIMEISFSAGRLGGVGVALAIAVVAALPLGDEAAMVFFVAAKTLVPYLIV